MVGVSLRVVALKEKWSPSLDLVTRYEQIRKCLGKTSLSEVLIQNLLYALCRKLLLREVVHA